MKGYIYVLFNNSMLGLLKIGMTERDVESRAKELSSATGVATPFICLYSEKFNNCRKAEREIHKLLEQYRERSNREFFKITTEQAIKTIIEYKKSSEDENEDFTKELENQIIKEDLEYMDLERRQLAEKSKVEKMEEKKKKFLTIAQDDRVPINRRIEKYEESIINMTDEEKIISLNISNFNKNENQEICFSYFQLIIDNNLVMPFKVKEKIMELFPDKELLKYKEIQCSESQISGYLLRNQKIKEIRKCYKLKKIILNLYGSYFNIEDKNHIKKILKPIIEEQCQEYIRAKEGRKIRNRYVLNNEKSQKERIAKEGFGKERETVKLEIEKINNERLEKEQVEREEARIEKERIENETKLAKERLLQSVKREEKEKKKESLFNNYLKKFTITREIDYMFNAPVVEQEQRYIEAIKLMETEEVLESYELYDMDYWACDDLYCYYYLVLSFKNKLEIDKEIRGKIKRIYAEETFNEFINDEFIDAFIMMHLNEFKNFVNNVLFEK